MLSHRQMLAMPWFGHKNASGALVLEPGEATSCFIIGFKFSSLAFENAVRWGNTARHWAQPARLSPLHASVDSSWEQHQSLLALYRSELLLAPPALWTLLNNRVQLRQPLCCGPALGRHCAPSPRYVAYAVTLSKRAGSENL
jgi:hypothetical protein